jgi:polysaccharide biosynthesis/export protein
LFCRITTPAKCFGWFRESRPALTFMFFVLAIDLLTWTMASAQEAPPTPAPPAMEIPTEVQPPAYRIGPGDILEIAVWKDEALTKQLPVLPDGTIFFPLVGKLTAGGRTVDEFQAELTQRIIRYAPDPVLSVSVQQVNSMIVYVIGRVNSPGRVILNSNATALQVLAMAGGPNSFAKRNKIQIFREETDRTIVYDFPYYDVSRGRHLEYNIAMKRGDVMVVP